MANSAARIAEIRAALSSTGKSVSNYSARFAAGEAPEQTLTEQRSVETGADIALRDDEVFAVLSELSKVSKVRSLGAALLTRSRTSVTV
jgi:hypothetical protein